jgi:hypothetical protein
MEHERGGIVLEKPDNDYCKKCGQLWPTPAFDDDQSTVYQGDAWRLADHIKSESVQAIITSPPYWGLRDYGTNDQFGLEQSPDAYVTKLVDLFSRLRRVLRNDGTVWLNLGDTYVGTGSKGKYQDPKHKNGRNSQSVALNNKVDGLKSKDLVGIPCRVAFALQADGWYLRQDIIWHKPNPMPEPVGDRCTKSHEYVFLLSKSPKYYFNADAIAEPSSDRPPTNDRFGGSKYGDNSEYRLASGNIYVDKGTRNKRSVWTVPTKPFKGSHFAVFPPDLIRPCILAGAAEHGVVLDPFMGSGTTLAVSRQLNRRSIGFELNPDYVDLTIKTRLNQGVFQL